MTITDEKEEQRVDRGMTTKGYLYKLEDPEGDLPPLYSKTLMGIGPWFRDYPNTKFKVTKLEGVD